MMMAGLPILTITLRVVDPWGSWVESSTCLDNLQRKNESGPRGLSSVYSAVSLGSYHPVMWQGKSYFVSSRTESLFFTNAAVIKLDLAYKIIQCNYRWSYSSFTECISHAKTHCGGGGGLLVCPNPSSEIKMGFNEKVRKRVMLILVVLPHKLLIPVIIYNDKGF